VKLTDTRFVRTAVVRAFWFELWSFRGLGAFRAQSQNSYAGKILRINRNTGAGYSSNPSFNGNVDGIRSKVWAYGSRKPFRFCVVPGPGRSHPVLSIGDVGWGSIEEVNISRGGEFYTDGSYPGAFQHTYLFSDFMLGWIKALRVDDNNNALDVISVVEDLGGAGGAVDCAVDRITGDVCYLS
jgi:hypothetical protein